MLKTSNYLHLDIETFSSVDLQSCGLHKYVESPDFQILLLAYAFNEEPVTVLDLTTGEEIPKDLLSLFTDTSIIKVAHNCAFERAGIGRATGLYLPPEQWEDTMLLAAMNGLPMTLEAVGHALNLEEDQKKMTEGKALIQYFCKPCKPTKSNGLRTRNLPEHAPDRWETFKVYNGRDVDAERAIHHKLSSYIPTDFEKRVFATDARINERGVLVDIELAKSAIAIDEELTTKTTAKLQSITGLDNPSSGAQFKKWLLTRGIQADSLNKASVADLLASDKLDPITAEVIKKRASLGKTSTTKYDTMVRAACSDGRVRGITQYYGAARTGRWAGRLVQMQNLPQNHLDDIAEVREFVRRRDIDTLELLYDDIPDVLSQLIRTAFIAKEGHTFLVADYSAIEARVIAYLSGETWRQKVFAEGGDIYCSSASQMFKVPVVKHGTNGHLRQKGKVAELACGYGGGVSALKAFGADKMGLSEEEMQTIVTQWRAASPTIPKFWSDTEKAAIKATATPGRAFTIRQGGIKYLHTGKALLCTLPSGRVLTYYNARLENGSLVFQALNQTTRKWEKSSTWGGKLVENIVQAFARDCLAVAMVRLEDAGYRICFHVHDEIIAEEPIGSKWEDMAAIMGQSIDWAPGLLLRADGYSTPFYMKD